MDNNKLRGALQLTANVVALYVTGDMLLAFFSSVFRKGLRATLAEGASAIKLKLFLVIKRLPVARKMIDTELEGVVEGLRSELTAIPDDIRQFPSLPPQGIGEKAMDELLNKHSAMDATKAISRGRVSGTVYSLDPSIKRVMEGGFSKFMYTNPLHPDVFRSIRKMEAEVVAMTLQMFHPTRECCGSVTSGGTESILLACLAYRESARARKNISRPELIVPITAHAAFEKAAHYFGIDLVQVPVDPITGQADVRAMKRCITGNTIALVASAPCFSLGTMDDVEAIAALAASRGLGCHVDCCLGGFLLPFVHNVPPFDFQVAGVTSISCDPHKYGYGPKGVSVLLWRHPELRRHQYFVSTEWTGGIYATATMLGSRQGAVVAATWAAMLTMGLAGYQGAAKRIKESAARLIAEIHAIPELKVIGEPIASVVAFTATISETSIYEINDAMKAHGWHLNALQNPPAIHLACTMLTTDESITDFIRDLQKTMADIKSNSKTKHSTGTAAIYGTTAIIPDKSIVADVAHSYLDILYEVIEKKKK